MASFFFINMLDKLARQQIISNENKQKKKKLNTPITIKLSKDNWMFNNFIFVYFPKYARNLGYLYTLLFTVQNI